MLASFNHELEAEYTEWFAFVRSHKTRFHCCNPPSTPVWMQNEDWRTIYPAMLKKWRMGHERKSAPGDGACHCQHSGFIECIKSRMKQNDMVTVQNCGAYSSYLEAKKILVHQMDGFR